MNVNRRSYSKMEDITDPDLAGRDTVGPAEDGPGNTTTNREVDGIEKQPIKRWQYLFNSLSTELHMSILSHMYRDPVSQICLGLVSQHWHRIFHDVVDVRLPSTPQLNHRSNYKALAPNLRCQVTSDEKDTIFGGWDTGYLLDSWDIEWNPSLLDLLWGEKWLWRGFKFCEGCWKYKPESAYESFYWERQMLRRHEEKIRALNANDIQWYEAQCKRCRARNILIVFEDRTEYLDRNGAPQERESLGLLNEELPFMDLGWDERKDALRLMGVVLYGEVYDARIWGYVFWREIWEELGI